jgi:hypothetical protein
MKWAPGGILVEQASMLKNVNLQFRCRGSTPASYRGSLQHTANLHIANPPAYLPRPCFTEFIKNDHPRVFIDDFEPSLDSYSLVVPGFSPISSSNTWFDTPAQKERFGGPAWLYQRAMHSRSKIARIHDISVELYAGFRHELLGFANKFLHGREASKHDLALSHPCSKDSP